MSAVVDFPVKPEARPYLEAFVGSGFARDRHEPDWLARYRQGSLARFAEIGFPSRRSEAWRYIDLRPLEQRPILPAHGRGGVVNAALDERIAEIGLGKPAYRAVLIDGRFTPGLSMLDGLPAGVRLGSMAAAVIERP